MPGRVELRIRAYQVGLRCLLQLLLGLSDELCVWRDKSTLIISSGVGARDNLLTR